MFLSNVMTGKATGVVCQWVMLFLVSIIKRWLEMLNVQMLGRGSLPKPAQHFPQIEYKRNHFLFSQQMVSESGT